MNVDIDKAIQEQIRSVIAQEIIAKLAPDTRDAVLAKGIHGLLQDWQFKTEIKSQVQAAVADACEKMLQEDKWQSQILSAIRQGLYNLIQKVPKAVEQATAEALFGQEGKDVYTRRVSTVAKYLDFGKEQDNQ